VSTKKNQVPQDLLLAIPPPVNENSFQSRVVEEHQKTVSIDGGKKET
jgi:hypothetical protein